MLATSPDADGRGLEELTKRDGEKDARTEIQQRADALRHRLRDWWQVEPPVGRVVDAMADRVGQLRALGNGQVPMAAATAWQILIGEELEQ